MRTETIEAPSSPLNRPIPSSPAVVREVSNAKVIVVWLLLCGIWGSTWLVIKIGLTDLPPFSFAGIRFIIASVLLLGGCALLKLPVWPRARGEWGFLALTGSTAFALNYGLLFWGEQHISSGLAAVLQASIPAFGMIFAHFHLPAEPLTIRRASGALVGLGGVGALFAHEFHASGPLALWGSVAIVVGAAAAAYSNVLVKARGSGLSPAVMAGWQMVFGFVPLLLAGFWLEGNPFALAWNGRAVACLLYLVVVGSVTAFILFYWLVQNVAVTKTLTIALATPVVAVALGWLILDERLTLSTIAGAALVLAGVGLIVRGKTRPDPKLD